MSIFERNKKQGNCFFRKKVIISNLSARAFCKLDLGYKTNTNLSVDITKLIQFTPYMTLYLYTWFTLAWCESFEYFICFFSAFAFIPKLFTMKFFFWFHEKHLNFPYDRCEIQLSERERITKHYKWRNFDMENSMWIEMDRWKKVNGIVASISFIMHRFCIWECAKFCSVLTNK